MTSDRSLTTLLRALQSPAGSQDATRLLGSAATLLTLLANPLNISLLTSQLLTAPAIWRNPEGLRTSSQIIGVFNAASRQVLKHESEDFSTSFYSAPEGLKAEDWVKAVVKGVDEKTPRWKHLLVLAGLLVGFEGHRGQEEGMSSGLRKNLEAAVVTAANLALADTQNASEMALHTVCLTLGYVFDLLNDYEKSRIDHNALLPVLIGAVYLSRDGLQGGYFLGIVDADLVQGPGNKFSWSPRSTTFYQVQKVATGPLISTLGSISRLTAFCMEMVSNVDLLFKAIEDLSAFSRSLCVQWRQIKLSEVDVSEEAVYLSEESLRLSLPLLWQVLKTTLFSIVTIQTALLSRVFGDYRIPPVQAPFLAIQSLHTLRNLYFITSRLGHSSLSQHTFVFTASIDILSKFPIQAEAFLSEIKPSEFGRIPEHPHLRCLDLFFLNAAENFTLEIPPRANEELLIPAATPYCGTTNDPRLVEIFEAAHSVMLAVFSAPQNHAIAAKHLPSYIDTLFQAFPQNLSPRQFRLAMKTLVRITSPPSLISITHPLLPTTLLEMVRFRSLRAPTTPLPPLSEPSAQELLSVSLPPPLLSEQAILVLTLIDALPSLPLDALSEEWLPAAAEAMNLIEDGRMRAACRQRFWEVLSNGEMDVARAERCVCWWGTRGGREMVLFGEGRAGSGGGYGDAMAEGVGVGEEVGVGEYGMSGASGEDSKL